MLKVLSAIGGRDLSAARLLEGHLNSLQLVALYGDAGQQARVLEAVRGGGLLGVWGADALVPLRFEKGAVRPRRLEGAKRYASGAGTVGLAIVPVDEDGALHLLLLDTGDATRVDLSSWDHRGMRATASGTYDFTGMEVGSGDVLGQPDDYRREPFFVGGIWRCAAAQLGAIEAIVAGMTRELFGSGRDAHPLQMARIGEAIREARTARLWVEDAAKQVETCAPDMQKADIDRVVAYSAYARLATEAAAMKVIDLAERAIGLGSFAIGHPVEALTRDLAVYIRQANPDAVLLGHGRVLARDLLE
ncbi:acyl-CoA dehydrogenase [Aureimonas flava]|uniref:Acyl-CoA dehydrogenase n=1 Tax=Aureimonas flava TaxID=2320271 RepID=A0A3A1WF23_9HYPH|nr:acyl-CoA dehydrogenase [Aureimonas flava]